MHSRSLTDLDSTAGQHHRGGVARAADAATLVTAALFVAAVVSGLSYAASRAADAVEDDPRRGPEPQLSRSVPVVVSALLAVALGALVVLLALAPASA